jgi:hypothetical protein
MDFFLNDPDVTRLPPEEVRLCDVQITTAANGRQVKIHLELTPFLKRPNLEVTIASTSGNKVAHTNILETMFPKLEFTMHLREAEPGGEYTLEITVYYQKMPEPTDIPMEVPLPEPMIVDHKVSKFVLPQAGT